MMQKISYEKHFSVEATNIMSENFKLLRKIEIEFLNNLKNEFYASRRRDDFDFAKNSSSREEFKKFLFKELKPINRAEIFLYTLSTMSEWKSLSMKIEKIIDEELKFANSLIDDVKEENTVISFYSSLVGARNFDSFISTMCKNTKSLIDEYESSIQSGSSLIIPYFSFYFCETMGDLKPLFKKYKLITTNTIDSLKLITAVFITLLHLNIFESESTGTSTADLFTLSEDEIENLLTEGE